ncbi:MAG: hypothetical protein K5839_00600, partial [Treponemataceae bacterium]|nr:hypothetical protein [Treponemataceae bacterium]
MVIGLLIFQLLLYALSIVSVCLLDVFSCEPSYIANIFMDLAGISISIGLYSFYLLTKKKSHADEIMMCFIVSETVILTSDLFCWLVQYKANLSFVNLVANFIFYQGSTIFPLIAWFFQVEVS